jgi:putative membrane protein
MTPAEVWSHWNTNPLILASILLPVYLFLSGAMTYRVSRWRTAAFFGGVAALFVALISPLDAVSEALFFAHMVQHLLLMVVAAPLLMLSRPGAPVLRGLWANLRRAAGRLYTPLLQNLWHGLTQPLPVTILHVATVWLWHIPGLYSAAFVHPALHLFEHASFFIPAALYWWMIINSSDYGARVISVFVVMMSTGLPGALMTFANAAWYVDHAPYVAAWGLTPLEDQQLAGLMMWIPAGLVYVIAAVLLFGAWLNSVERRTAERERRLMKEVNHG